MIRKMEFNGKNREKVMRVISQADKPDLTVSGSIIKITEDVRKNGDRALRKYTNKFDGVDVEELRVPRETIRKAYSKIDKNVIPSIKKAAKNIRDFHKQQKDNIRGYVYKNTGYTIEQKYIPVESAGLYIPGGQAPLFSTVLMAGIPAVIAGVKRICIVSPPRCEGDVNPYVLAAADIIGIKEIYRAGGAQAIAALAYGTRSIPKVDKAAGPGNIYSTMAKKHLLGEFGIDAINGPSEVTIVADDSAVKEYVLYDLLAQAEHINGHSVLITDSADLIDYIGREIKHRTKGVFVNVILIKVKRISDAVEIVNFKGPEHLSVFVKNDRKFIREIVNAPAVFAGNLSAVAFGDYIAGANHILPTNGTSRFFSALSVFDFMKHTHIVRCSKKSLEIYGKDAEKMALTETLENHMMSIKIRRINGKTEKRNRKA
ncbi:MAG TPA: histidinol dehydrogenase [Firmicutes bacterium]|nr:histidinol dehydrogenase [Bacillota bacterium]